MVAQTMSQILTEVGTNEIELMSFNLVFKANLSSRFLQIPFGINAAKVKEIATMPANLTILPQSHPFVEGIFVLRNQTIPLINLCKYFGYTPDDSSEAKKKWVVIIIELNGRRFGILVHGVDKVYRISWNQIESPPSFIAQFGSVVSMTTINNKIIQMLDFENLIAQIDPALSMATSDKKGSSQSLLEEANNQASSGETHSIPEFSLPNDVQGTILIAEDSKLIRGQMSKTLRGIGYQVLEFQDGLSAWDNLCEIKEKNPKVKEVVTCVITDIEMPRMDGHHLCKRIKEDPAFAGIPVLLFSSMINRALYIKGEKVGADDQITKPELAQLIDRTKACIEKYLNN